MTRSSLVNGDAGVMATVSMKRLRRLLGTIPQEPVPPVTLPPEPPRLPDPQPPVLPPTEPPLQPPPQPPLVVPPQPPIVTPNPPAIDRRRTLGGGVTQ